MKRAMTGEADIIQGFLAPLSAGHAGAFDLRDDAACLAAPPGHDLVVTVDAVAEGVHFFGTDAAADIGWKALAVNVSDLIAKGATPHAYVMALAFPHAPERAWLTGFATGLAEAQRAFGLSLVGGDTDRRPGPASITITAFGLVPTGRMVKRTTAQVGDHIFMSGTLGDASLGLRLRAAHPDDAPCQVSATHRAALIARYLRPQPPLGLIEALRAHASASMDISDGLVKDLGRMCAASGLAARIETALFPLSEAAAAVAGLTPSAIATIATGGDDYEVLATVAPGQVSAFISAASASGVAVTRIGRIVAGNGVTVIGRNGHPVRFPNDGWEHF